MPDTLVVPVRSDKFSMNWEITRTLFSKRSEYQQIDIVETFCFGRALLLDGHIQFSTMDEFAYHEALVQIPLLSLERPQRALVVGGGDGGVVRELTRHPSITQIDMVEIDPVVIEACRAHLPSLSNGAFENTKVQLHVADAFPFVKHADADQYDLIVLDSTDTYEDEEGEISEMLFTKEFYDDCRRILHPQGLVVTQADNPLYCPYSLVEIQKQFAAVFPTVGSYWSMVPSFGGFSAFCWASLGTEIKPEMPQHELGNCKYLNPLTWKLAMGPLPFVQPDPTGDA